MFGLPRGLEWVVILIIILLLFGPGRIGKVAGELGRGIRSFRDGLTGAKDAKPEETEKEENK